MSPPDAQRFTIKARWVFPVASKPISDGTVTISDGRIISVDESGEQVPDEDLGNVALIPGLVNAHTHLDLTDLRGQVPPRADFVSWLQEVIARRRTQSPAEVSEAIRSGLEESIEFGTTLLGDISGQGLSWNILRDAPVRSICYQEILGLPGIRVNAVWENLVRIARERVDTATCRFGVSPHAPYSVHRALIETAARLWPVAIHLAESPAEMELLEKHAGPFVPFLDQLGVWDAEGLAPSVDWVAWKSSRASSALLAHGNYLPSNILLPASTTVVYCPRTHAAFGHAPHPFREFLRRGLRVALGTDSLASNPDLDILAEARYLAAHHPDLSGEAILRMATLSGAEAMNFDRETGSLEPGKSADMVAVPLPDLDSDDPYSLLLGPNHVAGPRSVLWQGHWRDSDVNEELSV